MSRLWLISDCRQFWDTQKISESTQIASVQPYGSGRPKAPNLTTLKGKKVLFLVHEAKASKSEILDFYSQIERQACTDALYDLIVGYLWPGARVDSTANNRQVAKRMRTHLLQLNELAATVDALGDRSGHELILEALQESGHHILLQNFYALGPEIKKEPSFGARGCQEIYFFDSKSALLEHFTQGEQNARVASLRR